MDDNKFPEITNSQITENNIDRENYPRLSDILAIWSDFSLIDPHVLQKAAQRGTDVHAYCTAYAKGIWEVDPEENLKGYVDSFKQWYDENVEELISAEIRLYDDDLRFSGRYDMIVRLKGSKEATLIDLKTSASFQKDWPVRLAAYLHLLNLNKKNVMDAISIRLKKDGKKPCVKPYGDCNPYYKIFLSVLTAYDYFVRGKKV